MSADELLNVADYERAAAEALAPGPHAYFAGGAADERTLRDNAAAWSRWQLRPRVLVDVSEVALDADVLGRPAPLPIMAAPVAFQRLAHPDGEEATARAAAAAGAVMCLSTLASARPAEVAAAAPDGRRWFQLYEFRDRAISDALVAEATESGYEAIVLTVDAPYAGRRERDRRVGFEVPPEIGVPSLRAAVGDRPVTVREAFSLVDPGLTWGDLERLAGRCDLPVVVKGILTPEDARLAVEHGATAVVVSNHGGRQLDSVPATADVLGEVCEAVGGDVEVYVDGGIRRGTDILVALALGARAVLVGRPLLWGLAVGGEEGVGRVLALLREELALALALCGCPAVAGVSRAHVRRAPGSSAATL